MPDTGPTVVGIPVVGIAVRDQDGNGFEVVE